jgi:riboflavin synthase
MFTGLVEERGKVERLDKDTNHSLRLTFQAPLVAKDAKIGDSIAVNGCCLTVVKKARQSLTFEAGRETLSRTNLGRLQVGGGVNLERSLQFGERLGGHLVTGHIDGLATVVKHQTEGPWTNITFRTRVALMRYLAAKGSVAVDGVSLTVVTVTSDRFSVALIPHTLENTTLGSLQLGSLVNIETDLLAKYVERLLAARES